MSRYNRINLDGKSSAQTRVSEADVQAGQVVKVSGRKFVVASAGDAGAVYVVKQGGLMGISTDSDIKAGTSISAEHLEEGRLLAVLVASTVSVDFDTPLSVGANGELVLTALEAEVVAYAQEKVTVGASAELVLVRGA